jgi:ComF family protein
LPPVLQYPRPQAVLLDLATRRDLPDRGMRRALDSVLNLVYPDGCLSCKAAVSRATHCSICDSCWQKILELRIRPPWCPSCGLPYPPAGGAGSHLCGDCILRPPPFEGARAFGYYAAELSVAMRALKFMARRNMAALLAPLMASAFQVSWQRGDFDLVVPIPLHPRRVRVRGYNQAALLARQFAGIIGLPVEEKALIRVRDTPPQVGLSNRERLENLRNAFRCVRPRVVQGRSILLVDDVMTTGATGTSASLALLASGALRVAALSCARTVTNLE